MEKKSSHFETFSENLTEKYYSLKEDTRNIELLRRGVENLMREEAQRALPEKARGTSR